MGSAWKNKEDRANVVVSEVEVQLLTTSHTKEISRGGITYIVGILQ